MEAYVIDWLNLLVRWLHLIAGIAWIGASFYFVMLDTALKAPKKPEDAKRGVFGELWAIHGGGFYCSQKFLTGPKGEPLSEDLHWSKWEAYTTWLSGMGLLAIIYWYGASSYLIDKSVMDLSPATAVVISLAFIVGGWLVYNTLCKRLGNNENLLAALVFAFIMVCAWALFNIFGARGAYIHVGVMIGTMMVANVFFHIIPGQKKMVDDIRAGREPDPMPGIIGKQRSVHNTYFTLPVLFTMISNHYPMTYGHRHGWLVLGVIMLAGVLIRQFFVLRHKGEVKWALPATATVLLLGLAVVIAPSGAKVPSGEAAAAGAAGQVSFKQVQAIITLRCATCHSASPTDKTFTAAPAGVMFDAPEEIKAMAARIHERTVANKTMPLGNLTNMTEEERAILAAWYAQGANVDSGGGTAKR